MSVTPNRGLPLMEPSQAQPEVVFNDAMEILDTGTTLEVEHSGSSPGVRDVVKMKFVGATVTEESGGVAVVTVDATSGGGGGGSPLTVDTETDVTKITFEGAAVSVAPGATGEAVVTIDTVSGGGSLVLSDGVTSHLDVTELIFPGGTITSLGGGVYKIEFFALSQTPHLYWRVNILTSAFGGNCGFAEISMAATVGGSNELSGGTPTAIGADSGFEADKALDGNTSTSWNFASSTGWWRYQFASPAQVLEVKITARLDAPTTSPTTWNLEWSDDGSTWTSAKSFTAATWTTGATQTFDV